MPEILKETLKYSAKDAQILSTPPYIFSGVVMMASGWIGDKYKIRGPIVIFNMSLCLIGLPLLRWSVNGRLRYFSIFLIAGGCNSNIPALMTYQVCDIAMMQLLMNRQTTYEDNGKEHFAVLPWSALEALVV
jgi:hypothetical protein